MNPHEPIGPLLKQGASEEELQRIWRGIQRHSVRKPAHWTPLLLVVVFSGLVFAGVKSWWPVARSEEGLRDQSGRALSLIESSAPRGTNLSDGSRIELSADSALEVLDNDGDSFVCALRRGQVTFDVVPAGPRRWKIEVGAVAIEVVGTRFRVARRASSVLVEVERGAVLVRGENVRDGVQKLQPGARLEVPTARPLSAEAPRPALPAPMASSESPAPVTSSQEGAAAGSGGGGLGAAQPASTDLLTLADQQRRRGDLQSAIQTLKQAVEREPNGARGAMAAFTLGKLLLDGTGQPVEAAAAFRACLNRSPPAAIAEDALARLVEAQSRSGAREAALGTAREYQKRYPNGRRLSDVRRWTSTR
jgi:transmembrane sensor